MSFLRLLKDQLVQKPYEAYRISQKVKQASVSLLFRENEQKKLQLLLLRRAIGFRLRNSGDLCLPGGSVDQGEDDYDAAVRETLEETSIDLNQLRTQYLGRLPKNVFMSHHMIENYDHYVTLHSWLIDESVQKTDSLNLQRSEIYSFKWVDLDLFANYKEEDVQYAKMDKSKGARFAEKMIGNWRGSLQSSLFQARLDVGMEEKLYGLTLQMLQLAFRLVTTHPQYSGTDFQLMANLKAYKFGQIYQSERQFCENLLNTVEEKRMKLDKK